MKAGEPCILIEKLSHIKQAFKRGEFKFSLHGAQEAYEENILPLEIKEAIEEGEILEDYPEYRRGPCCLIYGRTKAGRDLHVVCSVGAPVVITTVYEPKEPRWITPRRRGRA